MQWTDALVLGVYDVANTHPRNPREVFAEAFNEVQRIQSMKARAGPVQFLIPQCVLFLFIFIFHFHYYLTGGQRPSSGKALRIPISLCKMKSNTLGSIYDADER